MTPEQRDPTDPEARDAIGNVTALVLAGGRSRRFGAEDKTRHAVEGRPMIRRAYDAVRAASISPVLVSVRAGQNRFAALPSSARYVEDATPNAGPLAGLVAGLRIAETDWLLTLACDLPFAEAPDLRRLLDMRAADVDAVVAEAPDGKRQPLCACYRRGATLPIAEAHLRDGRLAMRALLERLAVRAVPFEARTLRNVNRPADLPSADG